MLDLTHVHLGEGGKRHKKKARRRGLEEAMPFWLLTDRPRNKKIEKGGKATESFFFGW